MKPTATEPYILTWIICISGFTQHVGEPTGIHKLWLKLRHNFTNATTQTELWTWNSRWWELAEAIKISRDGVPPRVLICAYSWGAGWGFVRLARELRKRGIVVLGAVLADPVYRSRWLSFAWRSLIGSPVVSIPDNVRTVRWLRQRNNYPRGHDLVAQNERLTRIEAAVELVGVTHENIDDSDEFHSLAMTMVEELV